MIWYTRYLDEVKARERAEASRDAIRGKSTRQASELLRLTRDVEALKADKSALRFDLSKERAANAQLREALIEAQSRWEAIQTAADVLAGMGQPDDAQRACAGKKQGCH